VIAVLAFHRHQQCKPHHKPFRRAYPAKICLVSPAARALHARTFPKEWLRGETTWRVGARKGPLPYRVRPTASRAIESLDFAPRKR
jgi:hypothetical protein